MFSKVLIGCAKVAPIFSIIAATVSIGLGIHEAKSKKAYREAKLRIISGDHDEAYIVDVTDETDVINEE